MLGHRSDPDRLLLTSLLKLLPFFLSALLGLDSPRSTLEKSLRMVISTVTSGNLESLLLVGVLKDSSARNLVYDLSEELKIEPSRSLSALLMVRYCSNLTDRLAQSVRHVAIAR
jgi:hypothetical protein